MPRMRALHLPPPRLPFRVTRPLVASPSLGGDMAGVLLLQHHLTGWGVVKGSIPDTGVEGAPRGLRAHAGRMGEQRRQGGDRR